MVKKTTGMIISSNNSFSLKKRFKKINNMSIEDASYIWLNVSMIAKKDHI